MIRVRPYMQHDTDDILSWCSGEREFYRWTAGVMGGYPLTRERFAANNSVMRFTALEDDVPVGFFTLRRPGSDPDVLRFGFVIVDPRRRGRGCGRQMLTLGMKFAGEVYGAKKAQLAVFTDNEPAIRCYTAAGFRQIGSEPEKYEILGETWECMVMQRDLPIE